MSGGLLIGMNGSEVWAYVVERDDGLRIRFEIDDWQRLNLRIGGRVPVGTGPERRTGCRRAAS